MILNRIPKIVSEPEMAPDANVSSFMILRINFLIVWLFGYAPFIKVVTGLHNCLIAEVIQEIEKGTEKI
jgi:hypothetical protein